MSDPYGVTIFCDDVRQESNGKHIYIGVYNTFLQINEVKPHVLGKFCLVPMVIIPNSFQFKEFRYLLKKSVNIGENEEVLVDSTPKLPKQGTDPNLVIRQVMSFTLSPIEFKEDCYLASRGYFDGREIRLGVLEVRFRPEQRVASSRPKRGSPDD